MAPRPHGAGKCGLAARFGKGVSRVKRLLETAEWNLRALELFSAYLQVCPQFVKAEDVKSLTAECGVNEETAVRLLIAAACGLNAEEKPEDRVMEERYFPHAVHRMDASICRQDPYYQTIRLPEISRGAWRMGYKTLRAYEAFTADDLLTLSDGREIPQIGFFTEDFIAPMVEETGREWMTVTPSELGTMTRDVKAAFGKTVVFGLGLGYYAFMASEKPEVSDVTVIEREESVISLFREFILPQFPHRSKVKILRADAFEYARHMGGERYDCAYVDIWHDVLDGVPMYLQMKRLEKESPQTKFLYWIEPSMLAWLRGMALMEVAENTQGPMLKTIGAYADANELKSKLRDENLKKIAPQIPLEITKR